MRVYTFRVRQLMKQILFIEALRDVVDGSIQYHRSYIAEDATIYEEIERTVY
jgi:hypothetical protein